MNIQNLLLFSASLFLSLFLAVDLLNGRGNHFAAAAENGTYQ